MSTEIIGHEYILNFFHTAQSAGRLAHAYCFVGPEHVGKRALVEMIAADLQGISREKISTHPDVIVVEQERNEKTDKMKKNIDIEQMRALRLAIARHPLYGRYTIAIVDEAEKMNLSAANAMLKSLEEPGEKSIIFLLTKNDVGLPKTILSRCQRIYCSPVPLEKLIAYGVRAGLSRDIAETMARHANGLPGMFVRWIREPESYTIYQRDVAEFLALAGKPWHEKLDMIEETMAAGDDPMEERSELVTKVELWRQIVRTIARAHLHIDAADVARGWNGQAIIAADQAMAHAIRLLSTNVQTRLIMEHILLNIP